MAGAVLYLDASALVKLVVAEPETGALREEIARWPERASSAVSEVEVLRAVRRVTDEREPVRRAEEVLAALFLLEVDAPIRRLAGELDPGALRSLDALHLATALALGPDLGAFATYDLRLVDAARRHGLDVVRPGTGG